MKPFIGITSNLIKDDQVGIMANIGGPGQIWQTIAHDYIEAVQQAGGIPVMLPVLSNVHEAADFAGRLDGILFSGGCDISPLCFGENTTKENGEISAERDAQELVLMEAALHLSGFPILGICRGCQLLNVALGGSLVLNIDTCTLGDHFFPTQHMSVPTHKISVQNGSLISRLMQQEIWVNSYHHQCVDRPGNGVQITAEDIHGVPECIEVPGREGFTLGIQWHSETLAKHYEGHGNIFREFIRSADENRKRG